MGRPGLPSSWRGLGDLLKALADQILCSRDTWSARMALQEESSMAHRLSLLGSLFFGLLFFPAFFNLVPLPMARKRNGEQRADKSGGERKVSTNRLARRV